MSATNLLELAPDEIVSLVEDLGQPAYRGRQLATWIYVKGVADFGAMSDLSRELRDKLVGRGRGRAADDPTSARSPRTEAPSSCSGWPTARWSSRSIMPDGDRLTLCVSTQVGCGFGCAFCLTGTMGLVRNLTAGEIVGQVWAARASLEPGARLTHVVFMGMGEPLANYAATVKALRILIAPLGFGFSPRRITVSTVGLVRGLERLARENLRVNLAISLHAATDEVRSRLMPVNRGWGLDDLLAACRRFPLPVRQRMTFEYTLLDRVNDSAGGRPAARPAAPRAPSQGEPDSVQRVAGRPRSGGRRTERILAFQRTLLDAGLTATIRWSKGEDVGAACGQLAS